MQSKERGNKTWQVTCPVCSMLMSMLLAAATTMITLQHSFHRAVVVVVVVMSILHAAHFLIKFIDL